MSDSAGLMVQITDPKTGALLRRVPAVICTRCLDVVVAGSCVDQRGWCACCVRAARESA